jgi:predicted enzyme involved in methoxymalonyl-ACP biosynthesis
MTFQLEKTPWLPPAPADFSQRCKALAGAENGGALAASLASFALTPNQCGSFARALKKARKCLVLDHDNTCWGGVIGDDGLDGIEVDQGSARGEAFLSVQRAALDLRVRGVMLAVCSKNTDEVARGVPR